MDHGGGSIRGFVRLRGELEGVYKPSSVKLDWIARELNMGVRSGVTRAEQMLKTQLKNKKQVQVMWRKIEDMHHFYA